MTANRIGYQVSFDGHLLTILIHEATHLDAPEFTAVGGVSHTFTGPIGSAIPTPKELTVCVLNPQ
jgi:hypothetical protein